MKRRGWIFTPASFDFDVRFREPEPRRNGRHGIFSIGNDAAASDGPFHCKKAISGPCSGQRFRRVEIVSEFRAFPMRRRNDCKCNRYESICSFRIGDKGVAEWPRGCVHVPTCCTLEKRMWRRRMATFCSVHDATVEPAIRSARSYLGDSFSCWC